VAGRFAALAAGVTVPPSLSTPVSGDLYLVARLATLVAILTAALLPVSIGCEFHHSSFATLSSYPGQGGQAEGELAHGGVPI